jgi:hypothetical protein
MRKLPGNTYLAYVVGHEAWYWNATGQDERPQITVCAAVPAQGNGTSGWEFVVEDHTGLVPGEPSIQVQVFDDAFAAFRDVRKFFDALADGRVQTLDDVRALLVALGAVDETERERKS